MEFPECGRKVRIVLKKVFGGLIISGETKECRAIALSDSDGYKLHSIFFEGCCEMGCVFFSRETFATHVETWEYE